MNKTNRLLNVRPPAPVTKRPLSSVPAQTNGDARQFWQDNMARVYVRAVAKYLGIGLLITAVLVAAGQVAK